MYFLLCWSVHVGAPSPICLCADVQVCVIGASLSEPHINGTALQEIYGTTVTFCMYVYSNLANCKFTLQQLLQENIASVTAWTIEDS